MTRAWVAVLAATAVLANAPLAAAQIPLYDQTDAPSGAGVPDQNFETGLDAFDSDGADDFDVPAPGWRITGVGTVGSTMMPGGATVDVSFFVNAVGGGDPDLPGNAICSYAGLTPLDSGGSFTITLPAPCDLTPGTYWLGIQTNQSLATNGGHFWSTRSTQSGSEGVWRNPADGFGTGCTGFAPLTSCNVGGGASPDFLFTLAGDVFTTTTTSTSSTTTTLPPGGCGGQLPSATFSSLACRLGDLLGRANAATDLGKLQRKILKAATAAEKKRAKGEAICGGGDARKAAKQLKKAGRKMRKCVSLLDRLADVPRGTLLPLGQAIQIDLATLAGAITCP